MKGGYPAGPKPAEGVPPVPAGLRQPRPRPQAAQQPSMIVPSSGSGEQKKGDPILSDYPWDYAPSIQPGSKISFKRGDEIWTQTVESITHSTQPYVAAPKLPRWCRIVRRLTPRRWRKALPQPSGGMSVVTIKTVDPFWSRDEERP